jgi:gliding motility-associated-like protein
MGKRISLIVCLFVAAITLQGQNKKWILGSPMVNSSGGINSSATGTLRFYEAGFTGAAPVFTARTLGASVNAIASAGVNETLNSATDSAGNISFYVFANCTSAFSGSTSDSTYFVARNSFTGLDEVFAVLPPAGTGASSAKDLNIVKRDGFFNQYYVIYKTSCINTYPVDQMRYVTVDMNTRTISAPTTLLSGNLNEGMAVSVRNCTLSNRWFFLMKYVSGNLQVYRCSITSSGISAPALVYTISIPGNSSLGQGDIEISPTSDRIAFVNYTSGSVNKDIIVFDFDLAAGAISNERWINNPANYIIEVEFSPDGQRLYVFRGGTSAITPDLYNMAVPAAGVNYTIAASDHLSISMTATHTLEMAYDGNLYFAISSYNTKLYYISNPNADAATNIISSTPSSSFGPGNAVAVVLPEQIDGEAITLPPVNVAITGAATTICSGQSVTLTATGGNGYAWSGGSSDTTAVITVAPAMTTTYYATSSGFCGSDTDSITVNVDTLVNISAVASDDSICAGQAVNLSASGSSSYQWSGGISSAAAVITDAPPATTSYYVSGPSNACGSDTDTLVVVVQPIPVLNIAGGTGLCIGQSATLAASGASAYQWSGGSTAASPVITVTPAVTTTYYVTGSNGSCSTIDSVTVTVDTIPVVSVAAVNSICAGESITLTASGAASYSWSGGIISSGASVTDSPPVTTTYNVTGSNGGCSGAPIAFTVTVNPQPAVELGGPYYFCDSAAISQVLYASGAAISWSDGSNGDSLLVNSEGTYFVSVGNGSGCMAYDTTVVNVLASPVSALPAEYSGCPKSFSAGIADSYLWSTGDTAAVLYIQSSGIYSVVLTATSGCSATYSINATIGNSGAAYLSKLPNVFTPNGDGRNDLFSLGNAFDDCTKFKAITIFNRWGQQLFESGDPGFSWDGKVNGNSVPEGVYYGIVESGDEGNAEHTAIHITILR